MLKKTMGVCALAAALMVTSVGCGAKKDTVTETVKETAAVQEMVEDYTKLAEDQDVVNILLIGEDSYPEEKMDKEEDRDFYSDTVIVASFQRTQEKMVLTSLVAETVVDIPGVGEERLKVAYNEGGAELLKETVEKNFNIKIDGVMETEFLDYVKIVDAVDGLTINVEADEVKGVNALIEEINGHLEEEEQSALIEKAGEQVLNGVQALAYTRYNGEGKVKRAEYSRTVLQEKMYNLQKMDQEKLLEVANIFMEEVETDLTDDEMLSLCLEGMVLGAEEFEMHSIPDELEFTEEMKDKLLYVTADLAECQKYINEVIYK